MLETRKAQSLARHVAGVLQDEYDTAIDGPDNTDPGGWYSGTMEHLDDKIKRELAENHDCKFPAEHQRHHFVR